MAWRVAKSLDVLLGQLDRHAPHRDKASDGSIGDQRHSSLVSQHNPDENGVVCARDFTNDPAHGADMEKLAAQLKRAKDPRVLYVIWNRRIFAGHVGPSPWRWRSYDGTNPHDHHLHISVRPESRFYDDTDPWKVYQQEDELTPEQIEKIADLVAEKVWTYKGEKPDADGDHWSAFTLLQRAKVLAGQIVKGK